MSFQRFIQKSALHLCLLLGGIFLSLGAIELGFRAWGSDIKHTERSDRPLFFYAPPGSQDMKDFGYVQEKPQSAYRIAVVGDSFSFGPMMQFDDTFPKRLERVFRSVDSDYQVEVINFGNPGDSMTSHSRSVPQILQYSPDLLLLQITLNDIQTKAFHPEELEGRYRFGRARLEGAEKKIAQYWKSFGFALRRIHASKTHSDYVDYFVNYYEDPKAWGTYVKALEKIQFLARRKKVPVCAVIFPLFGHPFDENYPFHDVHRKIHRELQRIGIPFHDLFSTFEDIPITRLQVEPGGDIHPNEIAHRLAAESLFLWFRRDSLLPPSLLALETYPFRNNPREYTRKEMRAMRKESAVKGLQSSTTEPLS